MFVQPQKNGLDFAESRLVRTNNDSIRSLIDGDPDRWPDVKYGDDIGRLFCVAVLQVEDLELFVVSIRDGWSFLYFWRHQILHRSLFNSSTA